MRHNERETEREIKAETLNGMEKKKSHKQVFSFVSLLWCTLHSWDGSCVPGGVCASDLNLPAGNALIGWWECFQGFSIPVLNY